MDGWMPSFKGPARRGIDSFHDDDYGFGKAVEEVLKVFSHVSICSCCFQESCGGTNYSKCCLTSPWKPWLWEGCGGTVWTAARRPGRWYWWHSGLSRLHIPEYDTLGHIERAVSGARSALVHQEKFLAQYSAQYHILSLERIRKINNSILINKWHWVITQLPLGRRAYCQSASLP